MVEKFTISRDPQYYLAWPDVALTPSGKLLCVFAECTHHTDRSYTRVMLCESTDRGRTWNEKRPLSVGTHGMPYWNCPRITQLRDGRLVVVVDCIGANEHGEMYEHLQNLLFFSADEGMTWSEPALTPAQGIVPDKLCELDNGRWLLSCHVRDRETGFLTTRLWYSDDRGGAWHGPVTVGKREGLNLCEVSIVQIDGPTLVAFHRENSFQGWDCFKTISHDYGVSWSEPINFPLPGCHRPVAGVLQDGRLLITHRFLQGGKHRWGAFMQNFFAALTDRDSTLAPTRNEAWTRIMPIDYDRAEQSDLGYSGWVQFPDGEVYIVGYIVDDWPHGQIRGYSLRLEDFLLTEA